MNKTFQYVGAVKVTLTLDARGFPAKEAQRLVLEAAPGVSDATVTTTVLGGATIPTTGSWQGVWDTNVKVNADGSVGPIEIAPASAVIVDITHK